MASHPAVGAEALAILRHLTYRGEQLRVESDGPVALAAAVHDVTSEAHTGQPFWLRAAGILATFDGRLDEREALAETLGLQSPLADVALVAHAYARWRDEMADRLRGDFALVIWDRHEGQVYAARDILGIRPFSYHSTRDQLRWATDTHALVRTGASRVNEAMVGETLCGNALNSLDETLFADVRRLPPAHAMVWRAGVHRTWRYWTPEIDMSRWRRTDSELQEEFRAIFGRAVRSRLRASRHVAVMLSGGIDSSVVTTEAAGQQPACVRAYSMEVRHPPISEREYFTAVSERAGISAEVHDAVVPDGEYLRRDAERFLELPETPGSAMAAPLRAAMRRAGCRVVLTGIGGDEWFFGSQLVAADLLAGRQWRALFARLRADRQMPEEFRVTQVIRLAAWLQFTESQRRSLRRVLGRKRVPRWINRQFATRIDLEDRLRRVRPPVALPTHESRELFYAATSGLVVSFRESNSRIFGACGLEDRHPFHDRALVEFALSLPPGQRLRGATPKWVVRRAYSRELPPHVVDRGPGPDYSFAEARLIQSLGNEQTARRVFDGLASWIDADIVDGMMREMHSHHLRNSMTLGRTSWPLWLIFAVDFWNNARLRASMVNADPVEEE